VRIQKEKRKKVSQGEKTILARRPALGKKILARKTIWWSQHSHSRPQA